MHNTDYHRCFHFETVYESHFVLRGIPDRIYAQWVNTAFTILYSLTV